LPAVRGTPGAAMRPGSGLLCDICAARIALSRPSSLRLQH
jgi:hypothetical protein